jgi:hypothetical protein
MHVPQEWAGRAKNPDRNQPTQAADLKVVEKVTSAGRNNKWLNVRITMQPDADCRFLAKLGLAIGYKVFGTPFLATSCAQNLRKQFREADATKRRLVPVQSSGFLQGQSLNDAGKVQSWLGGWVLTLLVLDQKLCLWIVTPSAKSMSVVICDEHGLVTGLAKEYLQGSVWITIPSLGEAVGPIPLLDYLAHQIGELQLADLVNLAAKRIDERLLPPCVVEHRNKGDRSVLQPCGSPTEGVEEMTTNLDASLTPPAAGNLVAPEEKSVQGVWTVRFIWTSLLIGLVSVVFNEVWR